MRLARKKVELSRAPNRCGAPPTAHECESDSEPPPLRDASDIMEISDSDGATEEGIDEGEILLRGRQPRVHSGVRIDAQLKADFTEYAQKNIDAAGVD